MSRSIVVILNPTSSRGRSRSRKDELLRLIEKHKVADLSVEIIETSSPGEAVRTGNHATGSGAELARLAILGGASVVAAGGGDGTLCEVANGLIGSSVPLAVLPMGTGNDFARTIGLGTDPDLAVKTMIHGEPAKIDVGKEPKGVFLNIAGCGFDAEVAHRINHGIRYVRGTAAYLLGVVQTLAKMSPVSIRLTIDGETTDEKVMLCAVANARTYGGGMKIAPNADISDGVFDIVLVGDLGKLEFLRAFPSVFKGAHLAHPKVKVLRGSKVKIEAESPMPVLADGEELEGWPVEFEILPGALQVMMPTSL